MVSLLLNEQTAEHNGVRWVSWIQKFTWKFLSGWLQIPGSVTLEYMNFEISSMRVKTCENLVACAVNIQD